MDVRVILKLRAADSCADEYDVDDDRRIVINAPDDSSSIYPNRLQWRINRKSAAMGVCPE